MSVVRDLFATLYKMFAADVPMTLIALATVAICAAAAGVIGHAALPFVLACGATGALVVAVIRGANR